MVNKEGGFGRNFRFPWAKDKPEHPSFTSAVSLDMSSNTGETSSTEKIETAIKQYLRAVELRNIQESKNRIGSVTTGKEVSSRIFRLPEAHLQNQLLRVMYGNRNITKEKISLTIRRILASYKREDLQELQRSIDSILAGVESCTEAALALKTTLKERHPENETWIATNDQLDAGYNVDLVGAVEGKESQVETLYLVQVKSSADNESIEAIVKTHEEYLRLLPQLIGPLNKKTASDIAEKEVLSMESSKDSEITKYQDSLEEILLLGLVLDQYIQENTQDGKISGQINAKTFFERLKKEESNLNPFIIIGILKNQKLLREFRAKGYYIGNPEVERLLTQTAENIPYTNEEAITFYKKNNVNTILNASKIFSVVMVGGREVKRVELAHPLSELKN